MGRLILHISTAGEWDAALVKGEYIAPSLADEGFIHCSTPQQVTHVADWFYRDIPELVLLCVDADALESELRWERSGDNFAGDFPHVYGPIETSSVVEVLPWARGEAGFEVPDGVWEILDGTA